MGVEAVTQEPGSVHAIPFCVKKDTGGAGRDRHARGDTDGRGPTAAHRIRTRSDAMTHVVAPAG